MSDQKWTTKNLYLIRHAPVDLPYIYGQMDVEALFDNQQAFRWLADQLPPSFQLISSDLSRCVKTAEAILDCRAGERVDVNTDPGLREQHFGDWQGKTYAQIEAADQKAYQQFWQGPATAIPPGGESFVHMSSRVIRSVEQGIHHDQSEQDLVIVCHAGPIRAIIAHALKLPIEKALSFHIAPLSLSCLQLMDNEEGRQWAVHCINRVAEI